MSDKTFFKEIVEKIQTGKGSETIYGEPIERDGKTLVTVARVKYGFGGGGGGSHHQASSENGNGTGEGIGGRGMGFGGGVKVEPVGVIEMTAESTRFIPISDHTRMLAMFVGGMFGAWLLRKLF